MKDDRLLDDLDLKDAFRSVRDTYDGEHPESNLTLQRALFHTRTGERRRRLTRWVVLPIAAVFAVSTAWAGVTGKLSPAVQSVLESFHPEHAPPAPSVVSSSPAQPASVVQVASSVEPPPSVPEPAPVASIEIVPPPAAPAIVVARSATTAQPAPRQTGEAPSPPPSVEPSSEKPAPSAAASAPDPHAALFAEAHRLHFKERDPSAALAAWDRYLAVAPNGRFSPEARYNRALALVRLGRHAEAKRELAEFASGTYGTYRRDEAKALLDALARDASAP
jgi:hypothetical protein